MDRYFRIFLISMLLNVVLGIAAAAMAYSQTYDPKTYLHPRAIQLMPTFIDEANRIIPYIEHFEYIPALVEQESCISLKHSKCFSPTAELRNSREHGIGLFQLTRAWNPDGTIRFDIIDSLRKQNSVELKELSWNNVKQRPDLQIRAALLLIRSSYPRYRDIPDSYERLKFIDSAYNGGDRDVGRARAACKLTKSCNPNVWFGNVENHNPKSRVPHKAYGGQSMRDINNKHVYNVFNIRIMKYKTYIDKAGLNPRQKEIVSEPSDGKGN